MKTIYFILLLLIISSAGSFNLFAQTKDTLWTYDCGKYYLSNAVFSPDNQFIYATCSFTKHEVWKFDLQGHRIWVNDSVGGIKQFSEDGRFFWNYYGDKYDAVTFQKLFPFGGGGYNISGWDFEVNEKSNLGIACGYGKQISTQYRNYFDSCLIQFRLSNMQTLKFTSYPGKVFGYTASTIHPSGNEVAFLIGSEAKKDNEPYPYTDTMRIEIWRLSELTKEREIQIVMPTIAGSLNLKYSPDGSVLGYLHDGKLTLYNTTDYSVVWENDDRFGVINNFIWSFDMQNLYLSFYTNMTFMGLCKLDYQNKSLIIDYKPSSGNYFINLNKELSLIVTHWANKLEVLDNTLTSINEPFNTKNYQVKLTQTQIGTEFVLSINANIPEAATYTITNMLGKQCTKALTINLEQGLNQFEIYTSILPSGTYFLNLTIDDHTRNLKFMVVK
jgi:hypothetical protein